MCTPLDAPGDVWRSRVDGAAGERRRERAALRMGLRIQEASDYFRSAFINNAEGEPSHTDNAVENVSERNYAHFITPPTRLV